MDIEPAGHGNVGVFLFELLETSGLLRGSEVAADKIAASSATELRDIALQAAEITAIDNPPPLTTAFCHSATLSLSGWPSPCSSVRCRTENIDSLARFAALYSDRVYAANFLSVHTDHWPVDEHADPLRNRFRDDLRVLAAMRPLVEAGRIVPISRAAHLCPHCFGPMEVNDEERGRVDRTRNDLEGLFREVTRVELFFLGQFGVRYSGPSDLFDHAYARPMPQWLVDLVLGDESLRDRLYAGEYVEADHTIRSKLAVHEMLAGDVIRDASFELALSRALGTAYLADRPIQIQAIGSLTDSTDLLDRNAIIQQHLTAFVPFLPEVEPADLLVLREREQEAFILFRRALNQTVDEVRLERGALTEVHARQLHSDVLQPRLAELDRRLKHAKRDLQLTASGIAGSWTAAISFGLLSGLLPFSVSAAATALGIAVVQKSAEAVLARRADGDQTIRTDDFYFLWRVRDLASRSRGA